MVVTVVLSGLPKYVTLPDLAYNLDKVFDTDNITKFHIRDLPNHPSTNKRRVALDFQTGFDGAMDAQSLLHGYKYKLDNGREYTLSAKINHDPALERTTSFSTATDPSYHSALVAYHDIVPDTHKNILNMHLDTLRQQREIVRNERLLLKEQKKLRREKEISKRGLHKLSHSQPYTARATDEEGERSKKKKAKSAKLLGDSDSSTEKALKYKRKKAKKDKKKKKKKRRHSSSDSFVNVSSDSSPVIKKIKRSPSLDSRASRDSKKSISTALVPYKEVRRSSANTPRQYRSPSALSERHLHRHSPSSSKKKKRRSVSNDSNNKLERDRRDSPSQSHRRRSSRKDKHLRSSSDSSSRSSSGSPARSSVHSHSHSHRSSHRQRERERERERDVVCKRRRRSVSSTSVAPLPPRYRSPPPPRDRSRSPHLRSRSPRRYRSRSPRRHRSRSPPRYKAPLLPRRLPDPSLHRRRASPPSRYDVREHSVFVDKSIPSTSDRCRVRELEEGEDEGDDVDVDDLLQGVRDAVETDAQVAEKSSNTINITLTLKKDSPKKDESKTESKKKKKMPLPIKSEAEEESPKKNKNKKDNSDIRDLMPKPLVDVKGIKTEKEIKQEKDSRREKKSQSGEDIEDGEIHEIEDSDDDRRSSDSNGRAEPQYRTPYTPHMPWVPVHEENESEMEKRPAKNPRFILPVAKILLSMKSVIRALGNGKWRLNWMLTPIIQNRIQELVKDKGYLRTKAIVDLYRQSFPKEGDEQFLRATLEELDKGEHALTLSDELMVKQEKEMNGAETRKSRAQGESESQQWVPLSQPKVEPDDDLLILEEPKPVLDLTEHTDQAANADAGAESDASDETVVLALKLEPKQEPPQQMETAVSPQVSEDSPSIINIKEEPPEEIEDTEVSEPTEPVIKTENSETIATKPNETVGNSGTAIKSETINKNTSSLVDVSITIEKSQSPTEPIIKTLTEASQTIATKPNETVGNSGTAIQPESINKNTSSLVDVSMTIEESQSPTEVGELAIKKELNEQEDDLASVQKFVQEVRVDKNVIDISDSD